MPQRRVISAVEDDDRLRDVEAVTSPSNCRLRLSVDTWASWGDSQILRKFTYFDISFSQSSENYMHTNENKYQASYKIFQIEQVITWILIEPMVTVIA